MFVQLFLSSSEVLHYLVKPMPEQHVWQCLPAAAPAGVLWQALHLRCSGRPTSSSIWHSGLRPLTTYRRLRITCALRLNFNVLTLFAKQVTLGEEGFFAQGSPYTRYNPFGTPGNVLPGWSERIGQVSSVS